MDQGQKEDLLQVAQEHVGDVRGVIERLSESMVRNIKKDKEDFKALSPSDQVMQAILLRHEEQRLEELERLYPSPYFVRCDIVFAGDKELRLWEVPLAGYEIHHGQVARCTEETWFEADGGAQGYVRGRVFGTHWHGLLDNDDFRRNWLMVAAVNRPGFRVAPDVSVPARRDAQLDVMADLLTAHLDLDAVLGLLDGSTPPRPTITSALDHRP